MTDGSPTAEVPSPSQAVPASRPPRLRVIYVGGWTLYLLVYTVASLVGMRRDPEMGLVEQFLDSLVSASTATLPPAVLGIGVLALCRRVAWSPERRPRFFGTHAVGALVYGVASAAGQFLMLLLAIAWMSPEEQDDINPNFLIWPFFMGLLLYAALSGLSYALMAVRRLREQEARATRAESLRMQAELRALRAQLNPHFLFNTLHTLLVLVRRDTEAAEDALQRFGDLMRYALATTEAGDAVTLADEWNFVRNYLALERLRLGDRLRLDTDIEDGALKAVLPALTLQPLVENAIRHAVASRASGGTLTLRARLDGEYVELEVGDDGPGSDPEVVAVDGVGSPVRTGGVLAPTATAPSVSGGTGGHGLRLVRSRLAVLHGDDVDFRITTQPGQGFVVTIRLPLRPAVPPVPPLETWSALGSMEPVGDPAP